MSFNKVIQLFLPKDRTFHPLLTQVVQNLKEMSQLLVEVVKEKDVERRIALFDQITALEHQNDQATHQIFTALASHFITPFDREDIQSLAVTLDDIADYINATTKKMALYEFHEINLDITNLAGLIVESVLELETAITGLRQMGNITEIKTACIRINNLENKADDVFERAIALLFKMEPDSRKIMILKDLLECLETATDKCEDVAGIIESITIKYA